MHYLAEALKINSTISLLNLKGNSIGKNADNIKFLCDALIVNSNTLNLDICYNSIESNLD